MGCDNYNEWSCNLRGVETYKLKRNDDKRRWYQRDIDQIIHSIAFRKLQQKSQLLSEKDPRSRSRLIHTLEVSRIATEISERLGLNKELTEAISMGHDIGTSPYGRIGNSYLSRMSPEFTHEDAGKHVIYTISRVLQANEQIKEDIQFDLETSKTGMCDHVISEFPCKISASQCNSDIYEYHISKEVVDGVLNHSGRNIPNTLEGQVVRFADNIAYLSQDIDDLFAVGILKDRQYVQCHNIKSTVRTKSKTMNWKQIDEFSSASLLNTFAKSRGMRISAFIDRFIDFNENSLITNSLNLKYSTIFEREIPVLQIDTGLSFVIDAIWDLIEEQYDNPLIKTSNCLQEAKIEQLWIILSNDEFRNKNVCYRKFMDGMEDTRFKLYNEEWKKAYFISHLSWSEVDLIIDSFHKRDYTFDIDIELGGYINANS